jgi:hypothetical protein
MKDLPSAEVIIEIGEKEFQTLLQEIEEKDKLAGPRDQGFIDTFDIACPACCSLE